MADKRKQDSPKTFDIHRSLPMRDQRASATTVPPRTPTELAEEDKPKKKYRRIIKRVLISLVLLVLAFFITIGVWDERNITTASKKMFGNTNIFNLINTVPPRAASDGRVNVLLVGYSADDPGHAGGQLTDSIILLSMDPFNHNGYMLSIPRDLYVSIPGFGYGKINEAYQDGGMSLLEQVINNDFATTVNYYALGDYSAVRDIVNALGGITVDIQSPDPRGLYDPNINKQDGGPLLLKNGPQTIDGQTALNLTRARGDADDSYGFPLSDFNRTQHQRQVFTAIKAKLNWKLILNPRKNSQILNAIADNVKTDVPITQVRSLFNLFNGIPAAKLQSFSLNDLNGANLLQNYTTDYDESALVPAAGPTDFSQIDAVLQKLNTQ